MRTATVLTYLLSPITASAAGLFIIYHEYVSQNGQSAYDWLLCAMLVLALAVGTLLILLKAKLVSNFDITERSQRPRLLGIIAVLFAGLMIATYKMGYVHAIPILSLLTLAFLVSSAITFFWKVSFHTFTVTLCVILVISTYRHSYLYALLVIPFIVAWTRVFLNKHTLPQAVGGIILAVFILFAWTLIPLQTGF